MLLHHEILNFVKLRNTRMYDAVDNKIIINTFKIENSLLGNVNIINKYVSYEFNICLVIKLKFFYEGVEDFVHMNCMKGQRSWR